jgi:hypothetical protein
MILAWRRRHQSILRALNDVPLTDGFKLMGLAALLAGRDFFYADTRDSQGFANVTLKRLRDQLQATCAVCFKQCFNRRQILSCPESLLLKKCSCLSVNNRNLPLVIA